jgi:hypothetical protein
MNPEGIGFALQGKRFFVSSTKPEFEGNVSQIQEMSKDSGKKWTYISETLHNIGVNGNVMLG